MNGSLPIHLVGVRLSHNLCQIESGHGKFCVDYHRVQFWGFCYFCNKLCE